MQISRRTMLKLMAGGLAAGAVNLVGAAPGTPQPELARLINGVRSAVGNREIGLDLRQVDPDSGEAYFRLEINADKLYPVASCFKTWLALYYLWHTPRNEWRFDADSDIYSVVVYSNNLRTGSIIYRVGERIEVFGNPMEKFNDFLLFTVGMENGLFRWSWEGNPIEEFRDVRFFPSLQDRYSEVRGIRYELDNLFTAKDLADGYAFLLASQHDPEHGEAVRTTLNLCDIEVPEFPSPIERAFGRHYTGKDGVLPTEDTGMGRVLNDAGILHIGRNTYILSFLSAGEGEYVSVEILKQIAVYLQDYEASEL
jgi:hypothetical protein